ncbi:MAG: Ig-like domain-containing protein [Methanobacterium sp.]|nr:Ig-like domain-containing protein [Methanobacterium sp.]
MGVGGGLTGVGMLILGILMCMYGLQVIVAGLLVLLGGLPAGLVAANAVIIAKLTIIALFLFAVGSALLIAGGIIYGTVDSELNTITENKKTFIAECDALEADFKTHNNGAVNILPVVSDLTADVEQNDILYAKANAIDKDGDELYYKIVTDTAHGELLLSKDGTWIYTLIKVLLELTHSST